MEEASLCGRMSGVSFWGVVLHNSGSAKSWGSMSPEICLLHSETSSLISGEASFSRLPRKYPRALSIQERIRMAFGEFHYIDESNEVWARMRLCDPRIYIILPLAVGISEFQ